MKDLGIKKETAAAVAVLFSPSIVIPVLLFLLVKDKFVRFYVVQSLILFLLATALWKVFIITIVLALLGGLVWLAWFILWLVTIYKAWMGEEWEIPLVGKLTKKVLAQI
jgi:uncharacterized membrane protein